MVALVNNTSSVGVASVDVTASGTSIVNGAALSVATPNAIDFFSMFLSAFYFANEDAMAPPLTSGKHLEHRVVDLQFGSNEVSEFFCIGGGHTVLGPDS